VAGIGKGAIGLGAGLVHPTHADDKAIVMNGAPG
jgi:hypothetical protein